MPCRISIDPPTSCFQVVSINLSKQGFIHVAAAAPLCHPSSRHINGCGVDAPPPSCSTLPHMWRAKTHFPQRLAHHFSASGFLRWPGSCSTHCSRNPKRHLHDVSRQPDPQPGHRANHCRHRHPAQWSTQGSSQGSQLLPYLYLGYHYPGCLTALAEISSAFVMQ